jgi:hypothetical protein
MMTQITWCWVISPILDMEKEKQINRHPAEMKLQDEHKCLSLITNQIIKINEEGGFWTEVMGRRECVKLWMHFIAGDTSGHNNLVGHMNGGRPKFVYGDCRCLFDDLSSHIPMCSLITSEELKQAHSTEDGLTNLCKKNISNTFENVPFGDLKYGLLGSVPAEMLHVSILAYSNTCFIVLII